MGSMSVPTYLLVDGENIDATLGMSVLGRRPEPEERPRWDRVLAYCDELSSADATEGEGNEARALFFLNATSGHMPMSFIQALLAVAPPHVTARLADEPHQFPLFSSNHTVSCLLWESQAFEASQHVPGHTNHLTGQQRPFGTHSGNNQKAKGW